MWNLKEILIKQIASSLSVGQELDQLYGASFALNFGNAMAKNYCSYENEILCENFFLGISSSRLWLDSNNIAENTYSITFIFSVIIL